MTDTSKHAMDVDWLSRGAAFAPSYAPTWLSCYDVKFYPYTEPGVDPVFALAGADSVWICRPKHDANTAVEVLRCFKDEEITANNLKNREHQLNSVCWTKDARTGAPMVIVANDVPKIKVLDVKTGRLVRTIIGHGSAINDLAVCPTDPNILASCSMDYTIRIWNLSPEFESHPCVAMCAGEGHREGLLGIAWHQSGRYILSGGHDTVVNLWFIPELPSEPIDSIVKVFYPHFSSNEIHCNYVDCVQWYGDLILSRAVDENKINLWQIDNFDPSKYDHDNDLPAAPGPSLYKPSFTRSAFGAGFTRLLTFEVKASDLFFMRFALFHQPGKHPVLCAGNAHSRIYFWDLQQLEEGPPSSRSQNMRWASSAARSKKSVGTASVSGETSEPGGDVGTMTPSAHADEEEEDVDALDNAGFRVPPRRRPDMFRHASADLHRSESVASDAASSQFADLAGSVAPPDIPPSMPGRRAKGDWKKKYGIDDPFRGLQAHKGIEASKVDFCVRQVAWSVGGEWCVVCGDNGMVVLFSRWMKEA